jgi:hypothetical protein
MKYFFSEELTDLDVGIINAWDVTNYRRQFDVGTIVSTCLYCRKCLLLPTELQQTFAGQNMRDTMFSVHYQFSM